jgi:hypothetical protein
MTTTVFYLTGIHQRCKYSNPQDKESNEPSELPRRKQRGITRREIKYHP